METQEYSHGENVMFGNNMPDLTRWTLDSSDVIDEVEHKLRGEIWDNSSERYIKKYDELLNDKGINIMMSILHTHLTKNFKLTVLAEHEVLAISKAVRKDIIKLLFIYYKEYGAEKSKLSLIVNMVDHPIFVHLKSALNGETLKFLKTAEHRVDHVQSVQRETNEGGS